MLGIVVSVKPAISSYARFSLSLCLLIGTSVMSSDDYDPERLPDLLPIYYRRCFPAKLMCQWLSYNKGESVL